MPLGLIVINHCEYYWSKYCICAISNCIKIILLLLGKPIIKLQNCYLASVNKSVYIVSLSPKSSSSVTYRICEVAVAVMPCSECRVCFKANCV